MLSFDEPGSCPALRWTGPPGGRRGESQLLRRAPVCVCALSSMFGGSRCSCSSSCWPPSIRSTPMTDFPTRPCLIRSVCPCRPAPAPAVGAARAGMYSFVRPFGCTAALGLVWPVAATAQLHPLLQHGCTATASATLGNPRQRAATLETLGNPKRSQPVQIFCTYSIAVLPPPRQPSATLGNAS